MHLWPAWGSSEGRLRSWPRRYILGDETSIWKNTRHYAWERTKQFPRNRKALWATTPTYEEEQSWQSANNVFRLHRWMITCPGCAVIQPLEFKDLVFEQFRDEGGRWDLEAVEAETTWRCPHCQAQVQPKQRAALLQAGSAGVVEEAADRPRRQMSLRVTALDVPNIPWGETARKFLEAKAAPLDLKNFINSWLVEPWKDQEEGVRAVRVLSRSMDLNAGQCPENTDYILAGIDTQRGHVWVTVRAFLSDGRSVLLHCAKVEGHTTASALELCFKDVIEKAWPAAGDTDRILPVRLAVVDCADGETAEEVYKFAWRHPGRIWLIRGGVNMTNTWTAGIMDKYPNGKSIPGGVPYYKCSTSHYRERVIGAYLLSMKEEGAWLVASGTPTWYGDHIESWQLVSEQSPRGIKRVWKQIRRDDHCLDAELYCLCLADILKFVPVKVKAGEKPKAVHQLKRRPPARPQKPPKTRHNSIRRKY